MVAPQNAELFDAPITLELLDRKELGESRIQITSDSQSVTIRSDGMDDMYIELDESGAGTWGYDRSSGRQQAGLALVPSK